MVDGRTALGMAATASSSLGGYLNIIEPIVGIFFTTVVGSLTIWYTWERANKLRHERKQRGVANESASQEDAE